MSTNSPERLEANPSSFAPTVMPELAALGRRPVFLQFLNPEIRALYGVTSQLTSHQLVSAAMLLTRYAILLTEGPLVMPATYLFEVKE
ncbi:MAG: hypothetical protein M3326_06345, partial [Actinomycetota bacterium]|nr:hypothetical protein [Actinomycetota bacterium]